MAASISKSERLAEIIKIMRRHQFLSNFYHQTNPKEVLAAFQELGPTFIKMGQLISTRPDLVSPAYIKALSKLQDQVPADSYETVCQVIKNNTGHTPDELFKSFDHQPFASASVGQCHYATLKDGTKVVVKVQHPAVDQLIKADLALFHRAVKLMKYVPGKLTVVDFNQVLAELSASLLSEVNTMQEAVWGQEFYQHNNGDGIIQVPKVYLDQCHPQILVNQAMPGKSIKYLVNQPAPTDKQAAQQWQAERKTVAETLVQNFIKQVFVDHFFHADPHPGNILFYRVTKPQLATKKDVQRQFGDLTVHFSSQESLPPYRLVYLDFGMMGRLSSAMADGIAKIILAIASRDEYAAAQAVLNVCNRTGEVDEQGFTRDFGRFIQPYLKTHLADIDMGQLIFSMTQLCQGHHLQLRPEVTLLFKAFGSLEMTVAKLDPQISMMSVARPFANQWFKEHYNLKESLANHAHEGYSALVAGAQIPKKANRLLDQVLNGQGRVNLHYVGQRKVLDKANRMLNRLLIVIMLASLIMSSSILVVGSSAHPVIYKLGVAGWVLAIVITAILLIKNAYDSWHRRH
ncbi:ABC1 kinase family protein [Limosilactobacillus secaliphilus]|nr:AarF/UbiB family protein [Limosilactobacillus secaliphilus]